ncbi:hypothetical protein LCGC14_0231350 [marine sediment metagenome]|uniref:Uncharacterized protein n=1 Tax=marine sediment metagenome TaxID=412755 RepID=A0A0F9XE29_9ZZZZ
MTTMDECQCKDWLPVVSDNDGGQTCLKCGKPKPEASSTIDERVERMIDRLYLVLSCYNVSPGDLRRVALTAIEADHSALARELAAKSECFIEMAKINADLLEENEGLYDRCDTLAKENKRLRYAAWSLLRTGESDVS